MSKFKYSYQAFLFFPILHEEIQLPTGSDLAKLDAIAEIVHCNTRVTLEERSRPRPGWPFNHTYLRHPLQPLLEPV